MLGAVIGDLAGSVYEYEQVKEVKGVQTNKIIPDNAFFSDDTILTIAVLDAIMNHRDYEEVLRSYGNEYLNYLPEYTPYFKKIFSPRFVKWLKGEVEGVSSGNGAMMRISSIGYLFNTEESVIENAKKATIPSHNSEDAINCATTVALFIYYARQGLSKDTIFDKLNITIEYIPFKKFNTLCKETINNCLYAVYITNSFEESIKEVLSYGGDTDTNACIVGAMAEALYGISDDLKEEALNRLPKEFSDILCTAYMSAV